MIKKIIGSLIMIGVLTLFARFGLKLPSFMKIFGIAGVVYLEYVLYTYFFKKEQKEVENNPKKEVNE
jgi:threonine/homoserine/homoserine lactone efflux protein